MISQTTFVVVDCETSGLVAKLDKIFEIAAVKVLNGEIIDEWHSLVNPGIYVPMDTTNITGITSDMLKEHPTFDGIGKRFLDFFTDGSVFVAHNVSFDREFINNSLQCYNLPIIDSPYLCTVDLARHLYPNFSKFNLGYLSESFSIDLPQAHRAIHDARATAYILIKFLRMLQLGGVKTVDKIPYIKNFKKTETKILENQISLF